MDEREGLLENYLVSTKTVNNVLVSDTNTIYIKILEIDEISPISQRVYPFYIIKKFINENYKETLLQLIDFDYNVITRLNLTHQGLFAEIKLLNLDLIEYVKSGGFIYPSCCGNGTLTNNIVDNYILNKVVLFTFRS